jgi:NAD(P)H-hydrate epimerase
MKLVTVAEMRAIEKEANAKGLTYEHMMENAGQGLAEVLQENFQEFKQEGVLGLVGSGNNGGDTLVALAILVSRGWMGSAYIVRPRPEGDPLMQRLEQAGGKIYRVEDDPGYERLTALVENHALLLDGVLGTGVHLPLKKEVAVVLDAAGRALDSLAERPKVIAVDCPSGVDCDTGEAAVECIPADLTVTMAAVKRGLLKFPAFELMGDLQVVGIGLPGDGEEMESWRSVNRIVPSVERIRDMLPWRPADAHKGTFGTALIVAGSLNYTGAALLAGEAAYRIGTGLVTLAVPTPLHAALAGQFPEATWLLLPNEMGVISSTAAGVVKDNLGRATALLVGPGFGMEDTTREFLSRLLGNSMRHSRSGIGFVHAEKENEQTQANGLPALVIDADGLKLLADIPDWPKRLPGPAVLTPHPGEMSVLTGLSTAEIQADRIAVAERFSREWGHVVVLKGAFTVIAAPDGQSAVLPVATSALARAGTGDVLAGLIVGLRAQGLQAFPAAVAGAWIHAQAGLEAAEELGNTASVLASDVLRAVISVMSEVQGNPSG